MTINSRGIQGSEKSVRIITDQPQKSLTVGQTVKANIILNLSSDRFLVNLKGKYLLAESQVPLHQGESVNLRVISLVPKPLLAITGEQEIEVFEKDLFPSTILLGTKVSEETIQSILEASNKGITVQILDKLDDNQFLLQINEDQFQAETSLPLLRGDKLTLRVLSTFPRVLLEVISFNDPETTISLPKKLLQYFDLKEASAHSLEYFPDGNSINSSAKTTGSIWSIILPTLELIHGRDLSKGNTWLSILNKLARSYQPYSENKIQGETEGIQDEFDVPNLLQGINTSLTSSNSMLWAIPFPIHNQVHWADVFLSKSPDTNESKKNRGENLYSALIRLDTKLLGKLEIRVQLQRNTINAKILGNRKQTVKILQDNLENLKTTFQEIGFRVANLSATFESDIQNAKKKIISLLFPQDSTGMNIIA